MDFTNSENCLSIDMHTQRIQREYAFKGILGVTDLNHISLASNQTRLLPTIQGVESER